MKIYLTDQKKKFEKHLNNLSKKSVIKYDKNKLTKKISSIEINSEHVDFQVIFDYKIFPSYIMTHLTEWELNKREMKVGDIIVQQVFIPPIKNLSQKIIFGVRISEIFDDPEKKGFSYETLEGHVEKGISTFTLEKNDKKTIFKIETFSEPGNFIAKLMGSIFSKPFQQYSTNQALKNVKQQIELKIKNEKN